MRVLFVVMLTAGLLTAPTVIGQEPSQPEPRKVKVAAKRFRFVPSQVKAKVGETIEIQLRSQDVMHGFEILNTDIETKIPPRGRGTVSVQFKAVEKGKFAFRCSHKCGGGHTQMRGVIVVE